MKIYLLIFNQLAVYFTKSKKIMSERLFFVLSL